MTTITNQKPAGKNVHAILEKAAQRIWDEFGIRVDDLSFQWLNISTHDFTAFIVMSSNTTTWSKAGQDEGAQNPE